MKKKLLIVFLFSVLYTKEAFAKSYIIQDSEIEEMFQELIFPLAKTAKIDNLKIHIIADDNVNAFTPGGKDIFIYSGLINKFPKIDVIRGIIAHEIGHIIGQHAIRRYNNHIFNKTAAFASVAILSLAAALNPSTISSQLIIPASTIPCDIAASNILSYSRSTEAAADQAALKLLEANNYSAEGLIEFFESRDEITHKDLIDPYQQTHPLPKERVIALHSYQNKLDRKKHMLKKNDSQCITKECVNNTIEANHDEKTKQQEIKGSENFNTRFYMAIAKLNAFTIDLPLIKNLLQEGYSPEAKEYIMSIYFLRIGDFDNSVKNIDNLIKKYPNNPYFHELKGHILFNFAKKGALEEYEIASKLKPQDILILLGKTIVSISSQNDNQKSLLNKDIENLKFVLQQKPDNLTALFYLNIAYNKMGDTIRGILCNAVMEYHKGNIKKAKNLAAIAAKNLEANTTDWYQAQDILNSEDN